MIKSVTWMARNHVAANLLMIFVMVAGILGIVRMNQQRASIASWRSTGPGALSFAPAAPPLPLHG